ncbi:glycoside hydrolase family 16 protein [Demequina activiva]|uniref:GH16 domain-containing protein n=1 Tax=Demequina activiva TaxID=1582364 RepID=A0A919UF93_9MICO|nr:glycoside hydrolase family 16 protein [Demequina activiva]GIG53427.1 hypothetical protein Dac01nite_01790 [Demequina activiva]
MSRRILVGTAIVVVVAVVVVVLVLLTRPSTAGAIVEEASSTAAGTDATRLIDVAIESPSPAASEPGDERQATWSSDAQTDGAWISLRWDEPTTVSRVRIDGAGDPEGSYTDALVTFSDGSSVLVTADERGDVLVDIPRRVVRSAMVRFASFPAAASAVSLHAILIDDSGQHIGSPTGSTVTAAASDAAPSNVTDGDVGGGAVGLSWTAADPTADAWIEHAWEAPVSIASVQLAGPVQEAPYGGGDLVFSDGSTVRVSGVGSGAQPLTTVAFAPRTVTSVRFEPDDGAMEISEFVPYGPETMPPAWPSIGGYDVEPPQPAPCTIDSPAFGSRQDSPLALVCPATGTQVRGDATIVVEGPPGEKVTASTWIPVSGTGRMVEVAEAVVDAQGRAVLTFATERMPHGPFAVRLSVRASETPLYVQLFNRDGKDLVAKDHAPPGLTLQFEDTFDGPLQVSDYGDGAVYASTKPEGNGGSEFGGAVFANPEDGRGLLASLDGVLRIRAEPLEGEDPRGWDRGYASGLLSSMRVGGSGFSAQYGYFEARILAPGGRGTWPAFWMLDSTSSMDADAPSSEVDAVELYGHNTLGSCHALHNWPAIDHEGTGVECFDRNGHGDWALEWHTYGVHIRPDGAEYFIDGAPITTRSGLVEDASPYYFMLNLALDGGWPVLLDPNGGTVDMYVDWVRVYT